MPMSCARSASSSTPSCPERDRRPIGEPPTGFGCSPTFIAGRAVEVAEAPAGEPAHTNGQVIFVSAGSVAEQRREVLVQSALLGAGSLDPDGEGVCGARPSVGAPLPGARRPPCAGRTRRSSHWPPRSPRREPSTATAEESLDMARGRAKSPIRRIGSGSSGPLDCWRLSTGPGARATDKDLRLEFNAVERPRTDDEDDAGETGESKILKLFESSARRLTDPVGLPPQDVRHFARPPATTHAGGELQVGSVRRVREVGPDARPLPSRIHFTDDGKPGAAVGIGGALHPEWDVHNNRYRPDVVPGHRLPADGRRRRLGRRCAARRGAAATPVPGRPRAQGAARPSRRRRARHRRAHRPVRRSALRLLSAGTRLPRTPQAGPQPRRPHPARRLRIGHRYRSQRPRRTRPPAAGGRHPGRHTRRTR